MKIFNAFPQHQRTLICLIGHVIDHYDTTLYGLMVPILAPLFFPAADHVVQMICGYALICLGVVSRPLGALFFGRHSVRRHPKNAFIASLAGLSLATGCIGCLPLYQDVGWIAPALLSLLRLIQGFFAAGENAIAPIYMLEPLDASQRKFTSAMAGVATIVGIFCASGVVWLVNLHQRPADIWRWPFWACWSLGLFGFIMRRQMQDPQPQSADTDVPDSSESLAPSSLAASSLATPSRTILSWGLFLRIIAVYSLSYLTYALPFVFLNSWVPLVAPVTPSQMLGWNTLLLAFDGVIMVVWGRIHQQSSRSLLFPIAVFLAVSLIPMVMMIPGSGMGIILAVRIVIIIAGVGFSAVMSSWIMDVLPLRECYRFSGFAYALSTEIFGRSLPAVCMALWHWTGMAWIIGGYCALIAVAAAWGAKKPRNGHRSVLFCNGPGSPPPVSHRKLT